MRRYATVLAFVALSAVGMAQTEPTLKVGQKAPPIKVAAWVKGTPVKQFAKGKVYVVEFWATWCGPCRVSIPHLTDLAKKYKGKVAFSGISVWERGEDIPAKVEKFVKEMGDKMGYSVARDDDQATMAKSWMQAAGQGGIPSAFVVGKTGNIEWIGHPMGELDQVLTEVLAGTFDAQAAAEKQRKEAAEQARQAELLKPVNEAYSKKDYKGASEALDKILADNPEMEKGLVNAKIMLLMRQGAEEKVYAYAKQLPTGVLKDDAEALNSVAWMLVDDKTALKTRDYDVVIALASRAVELTKEQNPSNLDTLGYAYFKKGDLDQAISIQEKAVALLGKADVPQAVKDEVNKHLEEYKAAKAKG